MHPAFSVITFTVLSGAGYGLAFVLALGHGNPGNLLTKMAWFVALALIAIGLMSSTLHLGNPQRAWRAFSQWRTSWLSREGVMAVATFIPLVALAAMSLFEGTFNAPLGYLVALMCALTVYCTSMIYASLRTVPSWHTGWTPAAYLCFALTSGTLLYVAFFGPEAGTKSNRYWVYLTIVFLIAAWAVKYIWGRRALAAGYGDSTAETATGLGNIGTVRLLERAHTMGSYVTNEMVFRIGRKHFQKLRGIALLSGLIIPVVLLALSLMMGEAGSLLQFLAAISLFVGLFVERWLFFATARHAVGLYYGGDDVPVPGE